MSHIVSVHSAWSDIKVRRLSRSLSRAVSAEKVNLKMSKKHQARTHKTKTKTISGACISTRSFTKAPTNSYHNLSTNVESSPTNIFTVVKPQSPIKGKKILFVILLISALGLALTALLLSIIMYQTMAKSSTDSSSQSVRGFYNNQFFLFLSKFAQFFTGCNFLTFDDVSTAINADLLNGYGGLNWRNVSVYNTGLSTNYSVALVSGSYNAYNWGGGSMEISANVTNTFSVYSFYAASPHNQSSTVTLSGMRSGSILYSATISLNKYYGKYFQLHWTNIDRLYFEMNVYIAFDNMCIDLD
ncbi:hypothetical protein I4U23_011932 [Adineta vaga]|nr:hypothetical protein I4U23_011932 [Adineta vaga]